MAIQLSTSVNEKGTAVIIVDLYDEDSSGATPTSAKWRLTDNYGNVINSRATVTMATLSTRMKIVLTGDDLQYSSVSNKRVILVEARYDSNNGSELYLKEEGHFTIENFVKV